jgi:hypothetical protein
MIEHKGKGCTVKVIADSVSESDQVGGKGKRIVTVQLRYWRPVHAELMTHRDFSRNASSSRAIPVAKMIEQVRNDPAGPIQWGLNQPGMQAAAEQGDWATCTAHWRAAAGCAADYAQKLMDLGLHKQIANRVLEPFQFISVIVTATEWLNFFELRSHEDAMPEIRDLSDTIRTAMRESMPTLRKAERADVNSWHLPYVLDSERKLYRLDVLQAISAARCARVSYMTHEGKDPSPEADLALYDKLVGGEPLHASPTEHQAVPLAKSTERHKNFVGWHQYRADVELRIERAKKLTAEQTAAQKRGTTRR